MKTKNNLKFILLNLTLFSLIQCAHHRDVRPGANNTHTIHLLNSEKNFDSNEAMSQAQHFCREKNKSPVVISESNTFVGSMKESTYNNTNTGAKIATSAGSLVHVFGDKTASNAGGIVGLGGVVAKEAIGNGYKYEMKFQCE